MKIIGLLDEDTVNYKKICMTIEFPFCSFKCDKECGEPVCQNSTLAHSEIIEIDAERLVNRYINNKITHAVCFQGLEPLDSFEDVITFIKLLRKVSNDDIIIYTGYTEEETKSFGYYSQLEVFKNIIVKFGRFIPNQDKHYDKVLEVYLASDNQYAKIL